MPGLSRRLPLVSDGVVYRVLDKLLMLKGERLSYRTLDVEQIGSVYETMMGFRLEQAQGQTVALKPAKKMGAPVPVNVEALLDLAPKDRAKQVKERTDYKVPPKMTSAVKAADTVDAMLAALEKRIARNATPQPVPAGTMLLAPTDERRKTGSHYTPRSLTAPIVEKALEPVLAQFGPQPAPDDILALKVCDPAMGSGAFLVEACRQLAGHLVEAWAAHGYKPYIPADEDEVLYARRLVAQRCLYGVDKNSMAVDLSKLSLWLATLAKDHPFTFLDHALRAGDSLVGLTRKQIAAFHWEPTPQQSFAEQWVRKRIETATAERRHILTAGDDMLPAVKAQRLKLADEALKGVRMAGDACIAAFFSEPKKKQRLEARDRLAHAHDQWVQHLDFAALNKLHAAMADAAIWSAAAEHSDGRSPSAFKSGDAAVSSRQDGDATAGAQESGVATWSAAAEHSDGRSPSAFKSGDAAMASRNALPHPNTPSVEASARRVDGAESGVALRLPPHSIMPFHWEIEFPEVFTGEHPGFDAIVGNPPFAGKNTLINSTPDGYLDWLKTLHEESHGNADLVAHFFRRAYALLRSGGAFGLIATNTIGQGDTRASGLRWICAEGGGTIYAAQRRYKWPGLAAVVVSVVHIAKGEHHGPCRLDGRGVDRITAYLFHAGGHENPETLAANAGKSFIGSYVLGMGFTFDDTDAKGAASPIAEMDRLIALDPKNAEVVFPYIGGEEVNTSPAHAHHRYVINFGDREEAECRRNWPDLMRIVEEKVKPERLAQKDKGAKETWWLFIRPRPELHAAIRGLERVLVRSRIGNAFAFAFLPTSMVFNEKTVVFVFDDWASLSVMHSTVHEIWARFFSSTLKDDMQYTPSDCFETFPFPGGYETDGALETAGRAYYEYRAALMVRNDEGLTKTYNRFHDPAETAPDILELRALHAAMDKAVLAAYGWDDIDPACAFLLDYDDEDDEDAVPGRPRKKKKPWRYRWPDPIRDEVLARLLALNAERAEQERRSGKAAKKKGKK